MNTRKKGAFYEDVACRHLQQHGIIILERNFRCRIGEIDIIGKKNDCIIFFLVKYRHSDYNGAALAAVGFSKQKRICRCADVYCMFHPWIKNIRYDVIGITDTKLEWIENAFSHIGYSWN